MKKDARRRASLREEDLKREREQEEKRLQKRRKKEEKISMQVDDAPVPPPSKKFEVKPALKVAKSIAKGRRGPTKMMKKQRKKMRHVVARKPSNMEM